MGNVVDKRNLTPMRDTIQYTTNEFFTGTLNVATAGSAGFDLPAAKSEIGTGWTLEPGERMLIPTGLFFAIPEGYEGQVRPRSGLALNDGLTVLNAPGTIDSDYRGEVGVILINLGHETVNIQPGDRIAQIVFARVATTDDLDLTLTNSLDETLRGEGGFGSTGLTSIPAPAEMAVTAG